MNEYQIETRRRSRSKTPFLRSTCDHENCEHALDEEHLHHQRKRAKTPSVRTIIEEEVTSSSSPVVKKPTLLDVEKITSDYSSDDPSPDKKARKSLDAQFSIATNAASALSGAASGQAVTANRLETGNSSFSSSTTTIVTHKVIKAGAAETIGRSALLSLGSRATSTPKANNMNYQSSFAAQYSDAAQYESKQNELNDTQERVRKSLHNNSNNNTISQRSQASFEQSLHNSKNTTKSFSRSNNSGRNSMKYISTQEIDPKQHLPYMEYRNAGEYWNVTPKTDYTYSELSPHRRELAPGVVAMPNMSRHSLGNYCQRVFDMIQRNPQQEEWIRKRYNANAYAERQEFSDDDVDYRQTYQLTQTSWWRRFISSFLAIFTSIYSFVAGGQPSDNGVYEEAYYRKYYGRSATPPKGFLGTIYAGILRGYSYFYSAVTRIIQFDISLLRSSQDTQSNKRRSLLWLLLLLLLPWLLIGGWYLGIHEHTPPLASVRSHLEESAASISDYITANLWYLVGSPQANKKNIKHLQELEQNVQKSLSKQEYEQLLNHVNNYMQELMDLKFKQQTEQQRKLSPDEMQLIVQLMRENLQHLLNEQKIEWNMIDLNEAQIQHLALLLQQQLKTNGWQPEKIILTKDNLQQIKDLFKQQFNINIHENYNLLLEKMDLDAFLLRILQSPQLSEFIDARIQTYLQTNSQKQHDNKNAPIVAELSEEIAYIKLKLSDKLSENADLQRSISQLQVSQNELLQRLNEHELATDTRFSNLLAQIHDKLAALKNEQFTLLNKQVKLTLIDILGFKRDDGELQEADLEAWVRNTFVAKDYLEQRLLKLRNETNAVMQAEVDQTAALLMRDISARLRKETLELINSKYVEIVEKRDLTIGTLNETKVREIVQSVLAIYDADKTGLADFALESAGGQILSTRCTESYQTKTAQISVFGIPLWYPSNTPRVAISPNVQPGNCWAFQGFPGYLVLKLNSFVHVSGFTLEHIPRRLSPNGHIQSAPRNFSVWGLEYEKDAEPVLFGEYEYQDNNIALQYFPVQNKNIARAYEIVELRIESNHGHALYTCLYRFRVHGKPPAV